LLVPLTVALNCTLPLAEMLAVPGFTLTEIIGAEIVTVALADFVLSATLVAVTVTVAGEGTAAGAV
jgi:hypothetical protein